MRLFSIILLLTIFNVNANAAAKHISAGEFNSCYAKDWDALQALVHTMYTLTKQKKSVIFDEPANPSFSSKVVSNYGFFLRASQDNCSIDFDTLKSQCDIISLELDYGVTPSGYTPAYLSEIAQTISTLGITAERFNKLLNALVATMIDAGDCISESSCIPLSRVELPGLGLLAYKEKPYFYKTSTTFDQTKPFYQQPEPPQFLECTNEYTPGGGTTTPDPFGYNTLLVGNMRIREIRTNPGTIGNTTSFIYQPIDASHVSFQWKSPGSTNYGSPVTMTLGIGNNATIRDTTNLSWIKLEQVADSSLLPKARFERSYNVTDNAFQPTVQITTAVNNYSQPSLAPSWTEGLSTASSATVTLTTNIVLTSGTPPLLNDGLLDTGVIFAGTTASSLKNIRIDFPTTKRIDAFRLNQTLNTATHGVWNIECSLNGTSFVQVAGKITLGSHEVYLPAETTCKSVKLVGVSGSITNTSTVNEWEFKLAPATTYTLGQDITNLFTIEHTPGTTSIKVNDGSKDISVTY